MYGSVAEGGGRRGASGLWLDKRVCSMLTVLRVKVGVRITVRVRGRVKVRVRGGHPTKS